MSIKRFTPPIGSGYRLWQPSFYCLFLPVVARMRPLIQMSVSSVQKLIVHVLIMPLPILRVFRIPPQVQHVLSIKILIIQNGYLAMKIQLSNSIYPYRMFLRCKLPLPESRKMAFWRFALQFNGQKEGSEYSIDVNPEIGNIEWVMSIEDMPDGEVTLKFNH